MQPGRPIRLLRWYSGDCGDRQCWGWQNHQHWCEQCVYGAVPRVHWTRAPACCSSVRLRHAPEKMSHSPGRMHHLLALSCHSPAWMHRSPVKMSLSPPLMTHSLVPIHPSLEQTYRSPAARYPALARRCHSPSRTHRSLARRHSAPRSRSPAMIRGLARPLGGQVGRLCGLPVRAYVRSPHGMLPYLPPSPSPAA